MSIFFGPVQANRKTFLICLIATFIWGLIAHAYGYFSGAFSHDSLNEFNAAVFGNDWKIQLGRVLVPLFRTIFSGVLTMPWLIGLLSLLFIGLSVFLTTKIFKVQSKIVIIVIAGVFTANNTVTSTTATYINDLDSNMMALLLSVLAVWLWLKLKWGFLIGIIPVAFSMGLYQGYVSMTITLVMIYLILELLNSEDFKTVLIKGLKAIVMIIGGGVLYIILIKVVTSVTGVALLSGNYNSVDIFTTYSLSDYIYNAYSTWISSIYDLLVPTSFYPKNLIIIINIFIILIGAYFAVRKWVHIKWKEKILTAILIFLLPIGMNIAAVLSGISDEVIMQYAIWMTYLFVILLVVPSLKETGRSLIFKKKDEDQQSVSKERAKINIRSGLSVISVCLICVILYSNVQVANAAYLKKDMEATATLSLFTRIVYEMEEVDGYVCGETPVVFAGDASAQIDETEEFESISVMTGMERKSSASPESSYYQAYFDYVLMDSAVMADEDTWDEIIASDFVADMPCYPETGSIQLVDGVLVVKLSESD